MILFAQLNAIQTEILKNLHMCSFSLQSTHMCHTHLVRHSSIHKSNKISNKCYIYINMLCILSHFSHVQLSVTPWIVQPTRLLCPWDFSRQEYWSGLPFLSPGNLPNPGIESRSLASAALAGRFFTTTTTWEAHLSNTAITQLYALYCNIQCN